MRVAYKEYSCILSCKILWIQFQVLRYIPWNIGLCKLLVNCLFTHKDDYGKEDYQYEHVQFQGVHIRNNLSGIELIGKESRAAEKLPHCSRYLVVKLIYILKILPYIFPERLAVIVRKLSAIMAVHTLQLGSAIFAVCIRNPVFAPEPLEPFQLNHPVYILLSLLRLGPPLCIYIFNLFHMIFQFCVKSVLFVNEGPIPVPKLKTSCIPAFC